jgi:hypothetical protein
MQKLLLSFLVALVTQFLWTLPAEAQRVDCGNGQTCPAGNACLLNGMCARMVAEPPGAVRLSTGNFCDPGWRESTMRPGNCVPPGYIECGNGTCPPGSRCAAGGGCDGGPPYTGPICGGNQCLEGRVCSSRGSCMNPALLHDCGNGSLCSHAAACEYPTGCVYVSGERTRQLPK